MGLISIVFPEIHYHNNSMVGENLAYRFKFVFDGKKQIKSMSEQIKEIEEEIEFNA